MNLVFVEEHSRFASDSQVFTQEASHPKTVDVICALAVFIGARIVVEAGTLAGQTSFALAQALNGAATGAHIWTADIRELPSESPTRTSLKSLLLENSVTFFHGDFLNMLGLVPGEIDLAYLDASLKDPTMRYTHYDAVWPKIRQGGLVIVDDCAADWASRFRDSANIYLPQNRGLAILQKT